jgi:hypothetical protein
MAEVGMPRIRGPKDARGDFHDSSLVDIHVDPRLRSIRAIVSTPDERGVERLWMITFQGVLRFEYEHVGDGSVPDHAIPLELYDIYHDDTSEERARWVKRLIELGVPAAEARRAWHVVLASSFVRGWGRREQVEGIQVVCRDVRVQPAPRDYDGSQYSRPRIDAEEGP